jgi:hypothetical protein
MRITKKYLLLIIITANLLFPTLPASDQPSEPAQTNLPSSFSWRNVDGVDYTTPIKDQSPAPTCETYALCAALETMMQYQTGELYGPDLSETHLYFYAGGTYDAGGVNVYDAVDYLMEYGVPDEGCYPDPHRPFDYPYTSLEGWEERTVKITEWGAVQPDEESIKEALIEHGPLIICIFVYEDMLTYRGGVYHRSTDNRVGGHLVSLMGYDDETQSWLVKNSWGDRWGDNGWFHMGYDPEMFINRCYGGETGIIYIDGIYGNLKPDVPKISIETPKTYHSYVFNLEFPQIFRTIPNIQTAAPRIIGPITVSVDAENTEKIEFYVDGSLQFTDETSPFEYNFKPSQGLHIIETIAYDKDNDISRGIVDIFSII